jgi:hypothetical protein
MATVKSASDDCSDQTPYDDFMMTDGSDAYVAAAQASLTTATGSLDRTAPGLLGLTSVPRTVELLDGTICWSWALGEDPFGGIGTAHLDRGAFEEFLTLSDASDEDLLDFVRRWGPLWMCTCGRQWDHAAADSEYPGDRCFGNLSLGDPFLNYLSDTVADWRMVAGRARGLLMAAAAFRNDEAPLGGWPALLTSLYACSAGSPLLSVFAHMEERHGRPCRGRRAAQVRVPFNRTCSAERHIRCSECDAPLCHVKRFDRFELSRVITEWLDRAGVRLSLYWDVRPDAGPELAIGGTDADGLFRYIGVELAMAVVRSESAAFCASCGSAFQPRRKTARGRQAYCPRCRDRGRWRDAQRRRRQALAAAADQSRPRAVLDR